MPLFNKKPSKASSPTNGTPMVAQNGHDQMHQQQMVSSPIKAAQPPPTLVFHCQLANGSPTGLITGFSSVKELYQKIAECYDFGVDEVNQ
jgi:PDZ domain-containing protein GIPC